MPPTWRCGFKLSSMTSLHAMHSSLSCAALKILQNIHSTPFSNIVQPSVFGPFWPVTRNRSPTLGRYPIITQPKSIFHTTAYLFRLNTQLKVNKWQTINNAIFGSFTRAGLCSIKYVAVKTLIAKKTIHYRNQETHYQIWVGLIYPQVWNQWCSHLLDVFVAYLTNITPNTKLSLSVSCCLFCSLHTRPNKVRFPFIHCSLNTDGVTMTTEVDTNVATTLSRMNFSGYVGHATIFSWVLTNACCSVGLRLAAGVISRRNAWKRRSHY